MTNTHHKRSPHGPMELVYVQHPPRWARLFNSRKAMAAAVQYVYYRKSTNEYVIQNAQGHVTAVTNAG